MPRFWPALLALVWIGPPAHAGSRTGSKYFQAHWPKQKKRIPNWKNHGIAPIYGDAVRLEGFPPLEDLDPPVRRARILGEGGEGVMLRVEQEHVLGMAKVLMHNSVDPMIEEARELGLPERSTAEVTVTSLGMLARVAALGPAEGARVLTAERVSDRVLRFNGDVLGIDVSRVLGNPNLPYELRGLIYNLYQLRTRELQQGLHDHFKVLNVHKEDPEVFADDLSITILGMTFADPASGESGNVILKPDNFILTLDEFDMVLVDPF